MVHATAVGVDSGLSPPKPPPLPLFRSFLDSMGRRGITVPKKESEGK